MFDTCSFGKLGSVVVCCDINSVGNQQTVEEIEELGGKAFGYVFDCSDKEKVYETAEKIKKDVGDVTILINNAGVVTGKKFMDTPDELALKTFEVNTIAHFWVRKFQYLLVGNNALLHFCFFIYIAYSRKKGQYLRSKRAFS